MTASFESYLEIINLVHSYPRLIDAGDFAGIGELLKDAEVVMAEGRSYHGSDAVRESFEQWTRRYPDDGTPHTRHIATNHIVEIDDEAGTASCHYYMTVIQRTDEFPLQPVWANRYEDRFRRIDGRWRIVYREGSGHLPGDVSHHLLQMP